MIQNKYELTCQSGDIILIDNFVKMHTFVHPGKL